MFKDFAGIGKAIDEGRVHYQYLFKSSVPGSMIPSLFFDLNQTSGIPKYNPFAGSELTATSLTGAGNFGIYSGPTYSGSSKHLQRWQMVTSTSTTLERFYLCDYLMFYPLIDCDSVDVQTMDNAQTLPRYTNGKGVRIVLVLSAPTASLATITVVYTNAEGVGGRSVTASVFASNTTGTCVTTVGTGGVVTPFLGLASGDDGVRSVESVTVGSSAGGFICAVLVKPLATTSLYEQSVAVEKTFPIEGQVMPEIVTGACLNLITHRSTTGSTSYYGEFVFVSS